MLVYRICKRPYARDLSGTGAALYGGRWNPPGIQLLYTAASISLACLEYLVNNFHVMAPTDICLVKIQFSDSAPLHQLAADQLPDHWDEKNYTPKSTQNLGEVFVRNQEAYALRVPSAIIPNEFNVLLNPLHPAHQETQVIDLVDPFSLDQRLFAPRKLV